MNLEEARTWLVNLKRIENRCVAKDEGWPVTKCEDEDSNAEVNKDKEIKVGG